jgi:hypothetical protein
LGRIGGTAAVGAFDAAANTAIAGIATAPLRASFGDDISWQASEIATAALIGGGFGTIGGVWGSAVHARAAKRLRAIITRGQWLGTQQAEQRARHIVGDVVTALTRPGDAPLTPDDVDAIVSRAEVERAVTGQAHVEVRADPSGSVDDPLVRIVPEDIQGTTVSRGAWRALSHIEFSEPNGGRVKVIWTRDKESGGAAEVAPGDVLALPSVIRDYEPAHISKKGNRREWRVTRDGRTVVYVHRRLKGDRHVVAIDVQDPNQPGARLPLSRNRQAVVAGSAPKSVTPVGDTARAFSPLSHSESPMNSATANPAAVSNAEASLAGVEQLATDAGLAPHGEAVRAEPIGATNAAVRTPTGEFYSVAFEMKLERRDWGKRHKVHVRRASVALEAALKSDAAFAALMEKLIPGLLNSVSTRRTPGGWIWHHDVRKGTMQLVPEPQHKHPDFQATLHPDGKGGYATWARAAGAPTRK